MQVFVKQINKNMIMLYCVQRNYIFIRFKGRGTNIYNGSMFMLYIVQENHTSIATYEIKKYM